jgi:nonsense-mediated mRNA decay protein 3
VLEHIIIIFIIEQVKLTVQGEVANSSTILQQTFVVEYIVNGQMCDECRRVEAKDTWNASVSLAFQLM